MPTNAHANTATSRIDRISWSMGGPPAALTCSWTGMYWGIRGGLKW